MTSMPDVEPTVTGGADTHAETVHVAAVDEHCRPLADLEVPASPDGYAKALEFFTSLGRLVKVGVEGTGSYGAGLAAYLRAAGVEVVEVDRPDRAARRRVGKSDPIDAYAAAVAAATGRAAVVPKTHDGPVEAIRALRVARASAVKARTQTINQIKNLLITAPAELRESLRGQTAAALIRACAKLRPGPNPADPAAATKTALRSLARRCQHLTDEINDLDTLLDPLVAAAAPNLIALPGVGPDVAGQLLVTAGDNPDRLRSEAAFAHLCAAAPIPASSGRRHRHRLNRGGDRQANRALHITALTRMRHDRRTRDYVNRRTQQGLSRKDIIRCLKRYIAREIYQALTTP